MRWKASGIYHGGFAGASPDSVGRVITFMGIDILRIIDGQLVEYWRNADGLLFVQQLGVREAARPNMTRPPDGPTIFARLGSPAGSPAWEDATGQAGCDPPPRLSCRRYLLDAF